jgi:hypothetical protein
MFDTRVAYNDLLNDSRLDDLLAKAREQTVKVAGGAVQTAEELSAQANVLNNKSAEAVKSLGAILASRQEQRNEKVATVLHLVDVASRLLQ